MVADHPPARGARAPLTRSPSVWLGGIAGLALVATAALDRTGLLESVAWPCPFKWLTTLPCPLCGGTRAAVLLTHGDLIGAATLAPLSTALVLGALTLGIWAVAAHSVDRRGPDAWLALPLAHRRATPVLAALVFGGWGYVLVRSVVTGAP